MIVLTPVIAINNFYFYKLHSTYNILKVREVYVFVKLCRDQRLQKKKSTSNKRTASKQLKGLFKQFILHSTHKRSTLYFVWSLCVCMCLAQYQIH